MRASTASTRRPVPGSGNVPAIASSAIPNAGNAAPGRQAERRARLAEVTHRRRVDGLGAVERDPPPRQVEAVGAAQGAGRERVREVRPRGRRSRRNREIHWTQRAGDAMKSCGDASTRSMPLHERQREQTDQAHVVVQRQPRHRDVVVGEVQRRGRRRRGSPAPCGAAASRPWGPTVEPDVNCSTASESGSMRGTSNASGRYGRRLRRTAPHQHDRRITRRRARRTPPGRRRSQGDRCRRRGCACGSGVTNSSTEPSRIGSGSTITVAPAQPRRLRSSW